MQNCSERTNDRRGPRRPLVQPGLHRGKLDNTAAIAGRVDTNGRHRASLRTIARSISFRGGADGFCKFSACFRGGCLKRGRASFLTLQRAGNERDSGHSRNSRLYRAINGGQEMKRVEFS